MTTTRDFTLQPSLYGDSHRLTIIGNAHVGNGTALNNLTEPEIENLAQAVLEYLGGDMDDVAEFIEQCKTRKDNLTDIGEHHGDL